MSWNLSAVVALSMVAVSTGAVAAGPGSKPAVASEHLSAPRTKVVPPDVGSLVTVTGNRADAVGFNPYLQVRVETSGGWSAWADTYSSNTGVREWISPAPKTPWYAFVWGPKAGSYQFRLRYVTSQFPLRQVFSNTIGLTVRGAVPAWLKRLNQRRRQFGVPTAIADPFFVTADALHAKYMAKTGLVTHAEDPRSKYYTLAGDAAGGLSDVGPFAGSGPATVDSFMGSPYHALCALSSNTRIAGFGQFGGFAALTCHAGWGSIVPGQLTAPLVWPSQGMGLTFLHPFTFEDPDPWAACKIKAALDKRAVPVLYMFGNLQTRFKGATATITSAGTTHSACVLDPANAGGQQDGDIGAPQNEVIVVPGQSYAHHRTYQVTLKLPGRTVTTTFHTS
ncbi:MAG TPA: hypothetical protein VFI65_16480 [Streptosporangiaceae bacterium]|nr:hypothetical protein [Streptosporangiaceae bacterium]